MQRAIELGYQGEGFVAPNPMVGCVIVAEDGRTIGEGWHERFGESHAEVNAHRSIQKEDFQFLPKSTWYVTLEPCNHDGKTPACAEFIESIRPARIVIGVLDSNPDVTGGGSDRLNRAGIAVESGCLMDQVRWQNRRFFCNAALQRCYVVLKWAQSSDGFMDPRPPAERTYGSGGRPITSSDAAPLTHQWRAQEMGVLVGVGTALIDEPALTVRYGNGKSPRAIVIDPNKRLPKSHPLLNRPDLEPTIHVTKGMGLAPKNTCFWSPEEGLQVLLERLWKQHKISSLLVEGGSKTLKHFLQESVWDELKVWTAPHELKAGLKAPKWPAEAVPPLHEPATGFAGSNYWSLGVHNRAGI
jgi:diaminohydroxyphosphoribosylaminopyrimidine deaminase/5-amino-6-(5-phosphoribosylamino)uracil reductase